MTINLFESVERIFYNIKDVSADKEIILYNKLDNTECVFADKKMLHSILQNLVSNAIQYTPHEEKIIISSQSNGESMIVEVKDSGEGMSQEIVNKLFTPQLNTLLKARENKKGAGIGLLLVKGFFEKNNGNIKVESKEGEGTSFYFTLPINKLAEKIALADKLEFSV